MKLERGIADNLTGLGITEGQILLALREVNLSEKPSQWSEEELLLLSNAIRKHS